MGLFFTRLIVHFIFSDLGNQIFSTNFQDSYFYRGIWGIYQRSSAKQSYAHPQLFVDKLWINIKYVVKRVFFSYFLYNFGTKMASFVQFLANFGTKNVQKLHEKWYIFTIFVDKCNIIAYIS